MDTGVVVKEVVRDVGIFAGAALGILGVQRLIRGREMTLELDEYPNIKNTNFAPYLHKMRAFSNESEFVVLLKLIDKFVHNTKIPGKGFEANRLANLIPKIMGDMIATVAKGSKNDIATRAIFFEQDDLPMIESICENMIRNMLLDHVTCID